MRCLFCGQRLTLIQRMRKIEYCSPEHRECWEETQKALYRARLDDNMYQVRQILGQSAADNPTPSG